MADVQVQDNALNGNNDNAPAPKRRNRAGPQSKKRKVTTCLACKKRKVKCDRGKPQCDKCKVHYGSDAENHCVWQEGFADDDDQAVENQIGNDMAGWRTYPANQGSTSQDTNALLQRILRLESALQRTGASLDPDQSLLNDELSSTTWDPNRNSNPNPNFGGINNDFSENPIPSSSSNPYQSLNNSSSTNRNNKEGSISDSVRFPFSLKPTDSRVLEILSFLPDVMTTDFLLENYARIEKTHLNAGFSWRLIFMQLEILRELLNEAHNDVNMRGIAPKVDFSFLSLVFAILACSVEFTNLDELIMRGVATDEDNAVEIMEAWIAVSQACLCMADFLAYPNLNILMTLALLRQYFSARSLPSVKTLLAMSIRLAQTLGIHKLGTAKEDETKWIAASAEENRKAMAKRINPITSKVDSMLTRGRDVEVKLLSNMANICGIASVYTSASGMVDRSHLVRETGRRLWVGLVTADYYISAGFGDDQYQIHKYNTGVPLNVDERDLPDHNGNSPFILPRELPAGSPSESSIFPYTLMIVNTGKEASRMSDEHGRFTFEQTMQVDANFRRIFDNLPSFLRLDGYSEHLPGVKKILEARPYLATQRLFLHESIFNRLTMIHRHFLAKGHRDSQYEESTRHAVKASKMVLYCRREMHRIAPELMTFFVFRIHVFVSVSVLCIHLIELARQQINSIEAEEIRQEIAEALEFLNTSGPRGTKLPTPTASNDIIDALLKTETQMTTSKETRGNGIEVPNGKGKGKAVERNQNLNGNGTGNGNGQSSQNEINQNALEQILSPDDPLNVYINSLLDPNTSDSDLSPPNFFDVLDGFMPMPPSASG